MSGAPVIVPSEPDLNFIITDRILNFDFLIEPISPYDTYSSLGTVQGISEKQEDQVKFLMKKATAHNRALIHSTATQGQFCAGKPAQIHSFDCQETTACFPYAYPTQLLK